MELKSLLAVLLAKTSKIEFEKLDSELFSLMTLLKLKNDFILINRKPYSEDSSSVIRELEKNKVIEIKRSLNPFKSNFIVRVLDEGTIKKLAANEAKALELVSRKSFPKIVSRTVSRLQKSPLV